MIELPTHTIYNANSNTEKLLYNTRNAKGEEIVRQIVFSDPLEHKHLEKISDQCFLCAQGMSQGIPVKKIFSDVFTDWNQGKNPRGTHVCPACSFCILTSPERIGIRMFSLVAADKLYITNRVELRGFLLSPPKPPFVINLAVSQKKHICFKGEVNYSRDLYMVMFEEMPVMVDRKKFEELLVLVEHLMFGFTKTEISSGEYAQQRVFKFGIEAWQKFEEKVKLYRGTPLLDVVIFVAQKIEEEEKLQCFLTSVLKMKTPQPQLSLSTPYTGVEIRKEVLAESICGDKSKDLHVPVPKEPQQLELF